MLYKFMIQFISFRIMPLIREKNIFMLSIRVLLAYGRYISESHLLRCCQALNYLIDTEDFETYTKQYHTTDDVQQLVDLKEKVLNGIKLDSSQKRHIRELSDYIDKLKRQRKL